MFLGFTDESTSTEYLQKILETTGIHGHWLKESILGKQEREKEKVLWYGSLLLLFLPASPSH